MGTFDRIAPLTVHIDEIAYERRSQAVSSDFERVATTIVMRGGGHEGRGEDICYTPGDHDLFPAPASLGSRGLAHHRFAVAATRRLRALHGRARACPRRATTAAGRSRARRSTSRCARPAPRSARSWAASRLPLRFVVSTRLDIRDWLAVAPGLEFKTDPIPGEWDVARTWTRWPRPVACACATSRRTTTARPSTPCPTRPSTRSSPSTSRMPCWRTSRSTTTCCRRSRATSSRVSFDAPIHSLADVRRAADARPVPQHQALALRAAVAPLRVYRRLPGARNRALRRRPVRARRRARADSGDRESLLRGHAERCRPVGLQRSASPWPACRRARSRRPRGAPASAGDRDRPGGGGARHRHRRSPPSCSGRSPSGRYAGPRWPPTRSVTMARRDGASSRPT